jgi:hypothetical protein
VKKLLFTFLFCFAALASMAQYDDFDQDTVYMKSGKIIVGKIVNPTAEGSIQVRKNSSTNIYVMPSQIERMAIHSESEQAYGPQNKPSEPQPSLYFLEDDRFNFHVSAGLAFPTGSFTGNSGDYPGYAKRGWTTQASASLRVKERTFWTTQITFTKNAFDEFQYAKAVVSQSSGTNFLNMNGSPWKVLNVSTGATWLTDVDNDFYLFFQVQLGIQSISTPELRYTVIELPSTYGIYSLDKVKANAISNSLAAGVVYQGKYSLSLSMNSSRMFINYDNQTVFQPYRVFGLQAGYYLFHYQR